MKAVEPIPSSRRRNLTMAGVALAAAATGAAVGLAPMGVG